ncbi:MAG: SynChlorMet cassette protein ScmC [Pseudomonadota bacterium]|jgi:SynChlorMet cassette protein ScmC|nr:SynChlorMet cassette protein ScmC [Pseudomonadota bacterium]NLX30905.1 SynChlorMet cassette protein ScmC [Deltaproteobacteria bacterium]HNU86032.1 SynChlorMet cassette protein ScmC [Syntrophales bacterium]HNZ35457.1 SynChlorMet cassette protein ScmC [Syntrophales bacterium]HOF74059.1 SynChlorMet cassette protein ScmC [Syntrophales bacterium]
MLNRTPLYELRLADDQSWVIEPTGDTGEWVDEVARLLRLKPSSESGVRTIHVERLPYGDGDGEREHARLPRCGHPDAEGCISRAKPLELRRHPLIPGVVCRLRKDRESHQVKQQMRYALRPVYEETIRRGGLPLHAALVERDGQGVLLVGRSGVGKSTACRRLPQPWNALGDDLALAVRTGEGRYAVHPFPTWSAVQVGSGERTWDVNRSVSLSAIFLLTQGAEDAVEGVGTGVAAVALNDAAVTILYTVHACSGSGSTSLLRDVFSNAAAMARCVPVYILRLSLTGRFWEKIEEALEKGDSPHFRRAHGA